MNNFIVDQFIGFFIGICSSWIFIWLIRYQKPDLDLSPILTHSKKDNYLRFKIINSGNHQIINLTITVRMYEISFIEGTSEWRRHAIWKGPIKDLAGLDPLKKTLKSSYWEGFMPGTFTLLIPDADKLLEKICEGKQERRFSFVVSSTDAISGVTILQRRYYSISEIKEGDFGTYFELLNLNDNHPALLHQRLKAHAKWIGIE